MPKLTIRELNKKKRGKEKVVCITAYDYQLARLSERVGVDMILVGDSVGNNVLGYQDTRPVTMEEMILFSQAVRRGAPNTFVVGDMPLGSYQSSNEVAVNNAIRFIKEAEMDAVKCEGGQRGEERVRAINDAGIAVMGHIGYTPQSTNLVGIVQGNTIDKFRDLVDDSLSLQSAGAFAVLLEAVPNYPAGLVARRLKIPVYGIGSGRDTDGVLAIMHDVIGLGDFESLFVEHFCHVGEMIYEGISQYAHQIREGKFPAEKHFYKLKDEERKGIEDYVKQRKTLFT